MPFISNTDEQRMQMLSEIGVSTFEELLQAIPNKLIYKDFCCIEEGLSELEISRRIAKLADRNRSTNQVNSFLGGGIYDHYIPAAVDHVIMRPEFHTAYTPYQAEVSQGTLQYIYEYQTMICELTGMEISNAGMYDGASAAAEAVLMAVRKTNKYRALISETLNPLYRKVIKAYTEGLDIELITIPHKNGRIDLQVLKENLNDEIACVLVQTPNFLGHIEDMFEIEPLVHQLNKTLFIAAVDPISLPVLNSPAEYKADIVVGEGQALGNTQNFGGPLFGFLTTSLSLSRMMPGRIVGATVDADGNRAFALTLQTREQHIRRAKATSNICSNDALCTLAGTVFLSLMGPNGLKEMATQSTKKAHYLANEISKIDDFELAFDAPFFKEFALKTPMPAADLICKLDDKGIFAGIELKQFGFEDLLLVAVTEKKTKEQLDEFVSALKEVNNG